MENSSTKILISIVLVLTLIISAIGAYKYFSPASPEDNRRTREDITFPESGRITIPRDSGDGTTPASGQLTKPASEIAPTNRTEIGELAIKIVSERPIAGAIFIEKEGSENKTRKLNVRYMERESGHIYDLAYNENSPKKISNTTITRVYETYFNASGDNLLIRGVDENDNIQNIYAVLETKSGTTTDTSAESSVGKIKQFLLPSSTKEVAVSPAKNKIFYLTEVGGDFIGVTEDFIRGPGLNKKQVFISPFGEWNAEWPELNTLFFNTKPSANISGYLYTQSINRNGVSKILGDIMGLTSRVNPDGKLLIYSNSVENGIDTYIYDTTARKSSPLSLRTLPEKCVWGGVEKNIVYCAVPSVLPTGEYPDEWYQGIISFEDELWKIDALTGNTELIVDRATFRQNGGIDGVNLILSPDGNYLLLTNKKNSSLWQIKIK